jgi:hypothetical protein
MACWFERSWVVNQFFKLCKMAKKAITASIEETTIEAVKKQAKLEKRSFSQMTDLLLLKGLETVRKKQTGSNNA